MWNEHTGPDPPIPAALLILCTQADGWVETLPSRLRLPPARLALALWMQSSSSGDSGPTTGWLLVDTTSWCQPLPSLQARADELCQTLPWSRFHLQLPSLPSEASGQCVCLALARCTMASSQFHS